MHDASSETKSCPSVQSQAFTPSVRLADIPTTIEVVPSNKVGEELPAMSCNVVQMDVFARLGRARCIIRRDAGDAFLLQRRNAEAAVSYEWKMHL